MDGQHPHSGSMKLHQHQHHPADLWSHLSALSPNTGTLPHGGPMAASPFVGLRLPGLFPYASATGALPSLYGGHHHPHQLVYPPSSASAASAAAAAAAATAAGWSNLKPGAPAAFLPRYWLPHWAANPAAAAALFDPAVSMTQPQTEKSLLYSALQRSSPDSLPEAPESLPDVAPPSVTDKTILDLRVKNEPATK